jgi:preprotein translocase subunit SecA
MLKSAIKTILGSRHKREARKLQPLIDEINEIYEGLSSLSDEQLRAKTDEFRATIEERTAELKSRIAALREEKRHSVDPSERERLSLEINGLESQLRETLGDALEDILPEAFAVVKDTCRRLLGREITVTGQKMTGTWCPTTSSSSARSRSTAARSPRWPPARGRRSSRRCRCT